MSPGSWKQKSDGGRECYLLDFFQPPLPSTQKAHKKGNTRPDSLFLIAGGWGKKISIVRNEKP